MSLADDARKQVRANADATETATAAAAAAEAAEIERQHLKTYKLAIDDEAQAAVAEFVTEMRRIGVNPERLYHRAFTPYGWVRRVEGRILGWGLSLAGDIAPVEHSISRRTPTVYGVAVTTDAILVRASSDTFAKRTSSRSEHSGLLHTSGYDYVGFEQVVYGSRYYVLEPMDPTEATLNSRERAPFRTHTLREALVATLADAMEGKLAPDAPEEVAQREPRFDKLRRWIGI